MICADYARSKRFYTEVLGLAVVAEAYRAARDSYMLDLRLPDGTRVELFSLPRPADRRTTPFALDPMSRDARGTNWLNCSAP